MENKIKPMAKYIYWFWLVCWIMFGLSFFTSKSGLSIFSSLLIIISVFYVDWKAFLKEKWLVLFVMTLPLGMFLNLFSLGGWESSLKFLLANPWPLMIIPGFHLIKQGNGLRFFLWPLALSLVAAMVKSASIFYDSYGLVFTSQTRVHSFFDIGRWGQFVASAALALFVLSYPQSLMRKKHTWLCRTLFVFSFVFLILSNTRGPWLGFIAGVILVIPLMRRYYKIVLSGAILTLILAFTLKGIEQRIESIFMIRSDESGRITSDDNSNAGRLHMWRIAADRVSLHPIFGTGFRNSEGAMKDFLSNKDQSYLDRYTKTEFSYSDAHSSYLQSLVEMGIVFFIYYWGVLLVYLATLLKSTIDKSDTFAILSVGLLFLNFTVYIFYSSFASYEALLVILALLVGYTRLRRTTNILV